MSDREIDPESIGLPRTLFGLPVVIDPDYKSANPALAVRPMTEEEAREIMRAFREFRERMREEDKKEDREEAGPVGRLNPWR